MNGGINIKELNFSISINATKQEVWDAMLDPVKFKEWNSAFSPNSQFDGEWKQGTYIKFTDPSMGGGTKALLEKVKEYDLISAKHVAIITEDGSEDKDSDIASTWIGTTETYVLEENNGVTELSIKIYTHEDFLEMFNSGWPNALKKLKEICEQKG